MAEYQLWNIPDFSGGINNKVDDNLINDNECSDAQNVCSLAPWLSDSKKRAEETAQQCPFCQDTRALSLLLWRKWAGTQAYYRI